MSRFGIHDRVEWETLNGRGRGEVVELGEHAYGYMTVRLEGCARRMMVHESSARPAAGDGQSSVH